MSPIARPGETCWRTARARRFAVLLDNEAYFAAVAAALERARRSVMVIGWMLDPRTALRCAPDGTQSARIGDVLSEIAERRGVEVRVLIWDVALPISAALGFFPQRAAYWFKGPVRFHLDKHHPAGASQHQKLVVVDDALAFCSGADFGPERWDSAAHLDSHPGRRDPSGEPQPPRHAMSAACDGAAAAALGEIARARWHAATGEQLPAPAALETDPWPPGLSADFTDCEVAIARTVPGESREVESLHLAAIGAARRRIYLENQYLTAESVVDALATRLAERGGPEVILALSAHSPSYFDRMTMDGARDVALERLRGADRYGRLRAFSPMTRGGEPIVLHAKVAVIDDRLMRIGSANLSNRSFGLDSECDVAIDAALSPAARPAIAAWADRLMCHQRLQPLAPRPGVLGRLLARYHIGDPHGPADSFRPWRRTNGSPAAVSHAQCPPRDWSPSSPARKPPKPRSSSSSGPASPRPRSR